MPVKVAVIDSGLSVAVASQLGVCLHGSVAFAADPSCGAVCSVAPVADCLGHGTEVTRLVMAAAPAAHLLSAQVFAGHDPVSSAVVAAAIDWAVVRGAQLINLSLGLRADSAVLRQACREAQAAGVLLVGSAPARGGPVYPATYAGVIAVSGDARCAPGQWSLIECTPEGTALIGACPGAQPRDATSSAEHRVPGRGASYAAARITGILAAMLARTPANHRDDVLAYLATGAAFIGRERRSQERAA